MQRSVKTGIKITLGTPAKAGVHCQVDSRLRGCRERSETGENINIVIPAQAGIQYQQWISAFAEMTANFAEMTAKNLFHTDVPFATPSSAGMTAVWVSGPSCSR